MSVLFLRNRIDTLQRHNTENSETNIPRKGIAWPQYRFQQSCVSEQFIIYSQDRSAYSAAGKYVDRVWEYIKSLTDT